MSPPYHPIFEQFTRYKGPVQDGSIALDFLGTMARREFLQSAIGSCPSSYLESNYPPVNEDVFAWIDLLTAVIEAGQSFTMMELGAGYGLWSIRAAKAIQQRCGIPFKIVAVEAEPNHFMWLRAHFADNALNVADHGLIEAAVSDTTGTALFYIASPNGEYSEPREWYGQSLIKDYETVTEVVECSDGGRQVMVLKSGWRGIQVSRITLNDLLADHALVDLIHMDVQGQELPVVRASIDLIDSRVKYIHIGTHSREIETELRQIFQSHHWTCRADCPGNQEHHTPFGTIVLEDGVQSWSNPKFCPGDMPRQA
jgi:FkbM family methyltransferase